MSLRPVMRLPSAKPAMRTPIIPRRMESSAPMPPPPRSSSATSMDSYRRLSRPFAKTFLGAMLTYQLCYFGWEKMRTDEIMADKTKEVEKLEARIKEYQDTGVLPDENGTKQNRSWWTGWLR